MWEMVKLVLLGLLMVKVWGRLVVPTP